MARRTTTDGPLTGSVLPSEPIDRQPLGRFPALSFRNYRLFFCGQLVSVTGTWMQSLAQSYLVYDVLHASPFQLGLVNVCQFAPVIFLGIPAGVVVDRVPKRRLLVLTQSVFALLAAILAVLVASGDIQLWQVYAVALLFGVNNALDMPTRQSFVPELVSRETVMNAIALNSTMFNTGRVVGPAIAGIVLAAYGAATCFAINAVSYLAVIGGLLMMQVAAPRARESSASAVARLKEGLAYVRATPAIYRTIALVGTMGVFGMNFNVWIPMLASDSFDSGAETYGLLFSSMGCGSLLGALTLALFGRKPSRAGMLAFALTLGLAEVILALAAGEAAPVLVGMGLLAIAGFAFSNAMAMANSSVQTSTPDAVRGRVMAVYMTVFAGTAPFGALLSGAIADSWGIAVSIGIGGAMTTLCALLIAWLQRDQLLRAFAPHASGRAPTPG